MTIIDAIILGMVQGLTEFLPVSSSGHLELGKAIVGDQSLPSSSLLFTVVVHFATALSTLVVFWREVLKIVKGLARFERNEELEFTLKIIVSMVPAALIGLTMAEQIEQLFNRQVLLVGTLLIVTAVLLILADRAGNREGRIGYRHALLIGLAQAVAILPGISRSGATISASVMLGIDRQRAATFSFLMVVPLIFGKILLDILDGALTANGDQFGVLIAGFLAAFVTGVLACSWMVKLVRRSQLRYFSWYCFVVGGGAIGYQLFAS